MAVHHFSLQSSFEHLWLVWHSLERLLMRVNASIRLVSRFAVKRLLLAAYRLCGALVDGGSPPRQRLFNLQPHSPSEPPPVRAFRDPRHERSTSFPALQAKREEKPVRRQG